MAHRLRWKTAQHRHHRSRRVSSAAALVILDLRSRRSAARKEVHTLRHHGCGARRDPRHRSLARRTESRGGEVASRFVPRRRHRKSASFWRSTCSREISPHSATEHARPGSRRRERASAIAWCISGSGTRQGAGRRRRRHDSRASSRTTWRSCRRKPRSRRARFPASSRT